MQKLLLAVLVVGAGYYAWTEYGTGSRLGVSGASGGAGFSNFGTAAGSVAGATIGAVAN